MAMCIWWNEKALWVILRHKDQHTQFQNWTQPSEAHSKTGAEMLDLILNWYDTLNDSITDISISSISTSSDVSFTTREGCSISSLVSMARFIDWWVPVVLQPHWHFRTARANGRDTRIGASDQFAVEGPPINAIRSPFFPAIVEVSQRHSSRLCRLVFYSGMPTQKTFPNFPAKRRLLSSVSLGSRSPFCTKCVDRSWFLIKEFLSDLGSSWSRKWRLYRIWRVLQALSFDWTCTKWSCHISSNYWSRSAEFTNPLFCSFVQPVRKIWVSIVI